MLLAAYGLEPERRKQLRQRVGAASSKVLMLVCYLMLFMFMYVYGSEIVQFGRSQEPISRYEILNLIINVISMGFFVWACFYLYGNLGRGSKARK
jgi:hypothetical membrane protein